MTFVVVEKLGENETTPWNRLNKRGLRSRGSEVQILSGTPIHLIVNINDSSCFGRSYGAVNFADYYGKIRLITAVDVGKLGEAPTLRAAFFRSIWRLDAATKTQFITTTDFCNAPKGGLKHGTHEINQTGLL